jgi:hypothetical protein
VLLLIFVVCSIEAAGARVAPKRLPSGRTVGEPRMWLQNAHGPGLLLSRCAQQLSSLQTIMPCTVNANCTAGAAHAADLLVLCLNMM